MMQEDSGSRQPSRVPNKDGGSGAQAADRRWPGAVMVLLLVVALVWPPGGMAAAAIVYILADREQATFLFAAAVASLILRWTLLG